MPIKFRYAISCFKSHSRRLGNIQCTGDCSRINARSRNLTSVKVQASQTHYHSATAPVHNTFFAFSEDIFLEKKNDS